MSAVFMQIISNAVRAFTGFVQAHHDDADADANAADDVQFVVEHLVNSSRAALMARQSSRENEKWGHSEQDA